MDSWPEPVERVASYLREAGAEARLEEFPEGTPTARDAAKAVGCDLGDIVKSVVLACDERFIVVLVPGNARADIDGLGRLAGCRAVRVARAPEVEEATGFEPGAVSPFPLRNVARVFVERTLLARPRVWVGAGSPRHMLGLPPRELVRLARAEAVDAVEPRA